MTNKSGDNHPVHLHRHTFEVTKVGDKPTAGVMKDTINMVRFSSVEIDFTADDPGPFLQHQQQLLSALLRQAIVSSSNTEHLPSIQALTIMPGRGAPL